MVTAADLQRYVGASSGDTEFVARCLVEAQALVTRHVGSAIVPADILSRAVLECGSELYHRRQAPQGVAQFASTEGQPVRVSRDPMVAARPILAPYVAGGFA